MTVHELKRLIDESINMITFKEDEDGMLYAQPSEITEKIEAICCNLFLDNCLSINRMEFNLLSPDYYVHRAEGDSWGWESGFLELGEGRRLVFMG